MSQRVDEPPEYDPLEHPSAQVIPHPNSRRGGLPEFSDEALALKFTTKHGANLRYVKAWDKWLFWNGHRWEFDATALVLSFARELCRDEAARVISATAAKAVGSARTVKAIEFLARADRTHAATTDQWDRQPMLLGTPAGVVNLQTGDLAAASQSHYLRRQTAVHPAPPGTEAPLWLEFLNAATRHDRDLQNFLQRLCGYILTGNISEEVLTFVYGPGGAGKGVVLSTITRILGEYAVSVPIEVFTASSRINLEYYRAQMAGVRLVTASETEAQTTWAESAIKELTGNETPISGRHPYGEPFTFQPQFKIILVGNHAPRLKGRSAAMERRLRVIPFNNVVDTPDTELKDKLTAEYPAILRWMIDGALDWQHERLGNCEAVTSATGDYFEQQDTVRRWMDERCLLDPSLQIKPSLLLADFNAWAKAAAEDTMGVNEFAEFIDRTHGLRRMKTDGIRFVRGIGLRPDVRSYV